jgi:hypothetical protein
MARLQVADGGDGLQIWRAAANVSNKQSRIADKEWSSTWTVSLEGPKQQAVDTDKCRAITNTIMILRFP